MSPIGKSTRTRRRNKPKNPYRDFPLFPHATGRWAKKIRGKLHYFGKIGDDPKGSAALERFNREWPYLAEGRTPPPVDADEGCTRRTLCNAFLTSKKNKLDSGELSEWTFRSYYNVCELMIGYIGRDRRVDDLRPDDFEGFRKSLAKRFRIVSLKNTINACRVVFKYAWDQRLIQQPVNFGQSFNRPSAKMLRKARNEAGPRLFEADEIRRVLDACDPIMRAVVLLEIGKRLLGAYFQHAFSISQLYGSLGLIPLFMFWVYLMWLAVLFGSEVAATLQTLRGRRLEEIENRQQPSGVVDPTSVIAVMEVIAEQFRAGRPASLDDLADRTSLPRSTISTMLERLIERGLLHQVEQRSDTVCLAKPPEEIAADELSIDQIVDDGVTGIDFGMCRQFCQFRVGDALTSPLFGKRVVPLDHVQQTIVPCVTLSIPTELKVRCELLIDRGCGQYSRDRRRNEGDNVRNPRTGKTKTC